MAKHSVAKVSISVGNNPVTIEGPPEFVISALAADQALGKLLAGDGNGAAEANNDTPAVTTEDELELLEAGLEHGWNWFSTHAGQRMHSINFFLIASAFFCTGFVTALRYDAPGAALGIALIGAASTLFFHQLEKRVGGLVKAGERAMIPFENRLAELTGNPALRICELVEDPPAGIWKYSKTFRWLHFVIGAGFLSGFAYSLHCMTHKTVALPVEVLLCIKLFAAMSVVAVYTGCLFIGRSRLGDDAQPTEYAIKMSQRVLGICLVVAGVGILLSLAYLFVRHLLGILK